MIHSGKSDIYEWSLGFLNRIIVFALIFLHSVQPRLRFIHPGPAGLLITPECYADPLEEGIHALPHLQRGVGYSQATWNAVKDHQTLTEKVD